MTRLLVTVTIFLAACASSPPANDNFRQVMQRQVGKSADDSDFYPTLYRLKQMDSKRLPNGNVREQYAAGRDGKCKLYFETTPGARQVVGWSSEGDSEDCIIARPGR
jgi:hypothetical protein